MMNYTAMFDLTGKAAVVTGGSGGIGKAISLALASFGADVLIADIAEDAAGRAAGEISAMGRRGVSARIDISNRESVLSMAEKAIKEFGKIDILINSAGMNIRNSILDIGDEDWDKIMNVNLKGILYACQAAGKYMVQKRSGKIVNIASISSFLGHPARGAYAASKGGLVQLTRVMATEWALFNITVNAISPAAVDTPFIDGLKKDTSKLNRELERIPLGRIATPDDVVGAAILFSSGASGFITGQNLFIDGGRTVD